jgi:processive rubber oxygenase RoxA-like protein
MRVTVRRTLVVLAVFAAGLAGGWLLNEAGVGGPTPVAAPPLPTPPAPEGQNGLSENDRGAFYHLSEGGEIYPVDWLLALEVESTTSAGEVQVRPFIDNIERYGLLSDAKSAANLDGLPVGISLARSKGEQIDMIGLNCTACHVGQVQYQGHAVRIDGLGNMAMINAFLTDLATETQATLTSPRRLVRFWDRVRTVRAARRARSRETDVVAEDERPLRRIIGLLTKNRDLVQARLTALKTIASLKHSLRISTQEGYGRLDAFGIGRDELFGAIPGNSLPANAPVSFPHIWGMEYTGWLQWGANTNSVMERNIGQALGVGALVDPNTYESTLRIDNLHHLEQLAYKIEPPHWPASFPAIDRERAEQGKTLFVQNCAPCHQTYGTDGPMRTYQLFSVAETGTDPLTAINFELPVALPDGSVRPFPDAAFDLIENIKARAYRDAGYDAATIAKLENRRVRSGPQWAPTFRAPLLAGARWPDTTGRKVYRAKTLVGIWATGPFLHNGSVPTIYDLLMPAASRPVMFPTGTREYDPVKLGIQTDPSKYTLAPQQTAFTFDTRLPGNWNTGHEWRFYPQLNDAARFAIIEFLKTFTSEDMIGGPAPYRRAAADSATDVPPPVDVGATVPVPAGRTRGRGGVLAAMALLLLAAGGYRVANWFAPHGEEAQATEAADIAELTQGILTIQQRYAADQNRALARGTHAKGICVRGEFEVFDVFQVVSDRALAARLAQGIFAKPGVYPATVRFANAESHIFPDPKKDVRACSFAVELPPGVIGPGATRQDFSMNNARIFPINDAHAFAVTTRVVTAPTMGKGFRALSFKDKMGFIRTAVLGARQERPATVAYQQTSYWSTVPFHHGPGEVAKYAATACAGNYATPLSTGINCLQDELARHLNEDLQMSSFDFGIQLLDADRMTYWGRRRRPSFWIENASVEWKESQARFHTVGRLTLVARSVLPPEACAQMYIDVTANSAPDCKPLGSINRARAIAEGASRRARMSAMARLPSSNVGTVSSVSLT